MPPPPPPAAVAVADKQVVSNGEVKDAGDKAAGEASNGVEQPYQGKVSDPCPPIHK